MTFDGKVELVNGATSGMNQGESTIGRKWFQDK